MEILTRALDPLILGSPKTYGGMAMLPIFNPQAPARGYLTLDEALAARTARVTEVSRSGSVPELCFVNQGDLPVLLLDGEELVGAKQNRVLNLTILVPAGQTVVIPVSCVEAGRWAAESAEFDSSKQVMHAKARGRKSGDISAALAAGMGRMSQQGEVWADIDDLSARYGIRSATAKMTDVFEARDYDLDAYVRQLEPVEHQVGAVFALRGRVEGAEIFDHPEVLARLMPKLVRSWALDVLADGKASDAPPAKDEADAFLDEIRNSATTSHDAIGLGVDVRFVAPRLTGGALLHDDQAVHLCAFRVEDAGGNGRSGGRVESALVRLRRLFGRD